MKILTKKNIIIGGAVLCVLIIIGIAFCGGERKQVNVWYVEEGLENVWARILREAEPPERFAEVRVWDGEEIPFGPGILIATKPWKTEERVAVYPRLSWDLEYQGAIVLALDPWMVFRKHMNPVLTSRRVLSEAGGSGLLLIPGKDPEAVLAWTSRFIQEEPGKFPPGKDIWREWEYSHLFNGERFAFGARGYDWQTVLFRLMGNEVAWLYAPLSTIRRYRDPNKAILEATAFPELKPSDQYSLLTKLLWALPTGSEKAQEQLADTIAWLKNPDTQTIIADNLEWIPADPYGKPYDPVSLTSHRIWLTAPWVYTLY